MRTYSFTGPGKPGTITTVEANSEREARELAMIERWGRAPMVCSNGVQIPSKEGLGLYLANTGAARMK